MAFPASSTLIVLCGKTGSGKTLLLQHLQESGYPVINLEILRLTVAPHLADYCCQLNHLKKSLKAKFRMQFSDIPLQNIFY